MSLIDAMSKWDGCDVGEGTVLLNRYLLSSGIGSSSSSGSASSPQSSRSGTSSRSLRGLSKSWLVDCLPSLLAAIRESTLSHLVLGSASSGMPYSSKP